MASIGEQLWDVVKVATKLLKGCSKVAKGFRKVAERVQKGYARTLVLLLFVFVLFGVKCGVCYVGGYAFISLQFGF